METITRIISPQEDGATVRHILKAELHFSTHAVARLTRAERGILVNGRRARTVDLLHTGDVLTVETGDHRSRSKSRVKRFTCSHRWRIGSACTPSRANSKTSA